MAMPQDDSLDEFDGPWNEEPFGPNRATAQPAKAPAPEPLEELGDGEAWGIPELEIEAKLRPGRVEVGAAAKEKELGNARRKVVNAILPEVMNRAEGLRLRIWQEYERAIKEARREGQDDRTTRALEVLGRARRLRESSLADLRKELADHARDVEAVHVTRLADRKPEALAPIIGEALQKGLNALIILLRVNPHDLKRMNEAEPSLLAGIEQSADLDVRMDEWVKPGTCVVETEAGNIDAAPETPPEQAASILLNPPDESS